MHCQIHASFKSAWLNQMITHWRRREQNLLCKNLVHMLLNDLAHSQGSLSIWQTPQELKIGGYTCDERINMRHRIYVMYWVHKKFANSILLCCKLSSFARGKKDWSCECSETCNSFWTTCLSYNINSPSYSYRYWSQVFIQCHKHSWLNTKRYKHFSVKNTTSFKR